MHKEKPVVREDEPAQQMPDSSGIPREIQRILKKPVAMRTRKQAERLRSWEMLSNQKQLSAICQDQQSYLEQLRPLLDPFLNYYAAIKEWDDNDVLLSQQFIPDVPECKTEMVEISVKDFRNLFHKVFGV